MTSIRRILGLVTLVSLLFTAARAEAQEPSAIHSAMTPRVIARLRAVLASSRNARDAFVKIGDSNTANPSFLTCFAGKDHRLGDHADLEETRRFFASRRVEGRTSFDRVSLSATAGWITRQPLAGAWSPLLREVAAVEPAFAVVMLGTNDNRVNGMDAFVEALPRVVDALLARGVVPLLSTVPPRDDTPGASGRVPAYNRVIRALARSREIPLMDLHAALAPLPKHGLVADGVHLASAWKSGAPRACWLTADGLRHGMNMRNLVVLQALDRARRFLVEGQSAEVGA